jgi:8-oxo-dGTP pyrophosphatase MutT (NUDIX family)
MWFARRSPTKPIDPGMLDNLVGGGIVTGQSVESTVIKESWEEAGIDAEIAQAARAAGTIDIRRVQPDGLQRETIFVHDLHLPADFSPAGRDGEAVAHRRVDFDGAARLISCANGPDMVTVDDPTLLREMFFRHGAIDVAAPIPPLSGPPPRGRDAVRQSASVMQRRALAIVGLTSRCQAQPACRAPH